MLVNMDGTSILSLPDGIKKVINALSEYFIARLYRCYILGLNIVLRAIYKIICHFRALAHVMDAVNNDFATIILFGSYYVDLKCVFVDWDEAFYVAHHLRIISGGHKH